MPKVKIRPEDEPTAVLSHGEKTISAQEVLVPIYEEHLNPENVLNYMFEKNKYSFDGLGERSN